MSDAPAILPDALRSLLDGTDLADKVGHTLLLIAGGDVPRVAMLSVGEVYTPDPDQVRMAIYEGSRTTRQVMESGRCLLFFVLDDTVYKIALRLTGSQTFDDDPINVYLRADITDVKAMDKPRGFGADCFHVRERAYGVSARF